MNKKKAKILVIGIISFTKVTPRQANQHLCNHMQKKITNSPVITTW